MICPHCGKEHPDNYKFCPFTNKQIMKRVSCSNENCSEYRKPLFLDGAICCPICGSALSGEEVKNIDSSVNKQQTDMPNSTSNSNLSSEDTTFSNSKNHKLQHSYDEIYEFYDGLARVQRNGMYGFINESGEEVIPCKYEYLSIFFISVQ